jgi:hypothetical protein
MKNQQIETSSELLNVIRGLIVEAKKNEFILDVMVEKIEEFLYGNLLQNIFKNLLDDNNKDDLYKDFGVNDKEITKIRQNPNIADFLTSENPKGTDSEYNEFKNSASRILSPQISAFIESFEKACLLDECKNEIDKLRKESMSASELSNKLVNNIKMGFQRDNGTFSALDQSKKEYFSKYSREQLLDIERQSPGTVPKELFDED